MIQRPSSEPKGVLLSLRLNSGAIQQLPTMLLPGAPTTFGRRLQEALAAYKAAKAATLAR